MKKALSVVFALMLVMSLFAACSKDKGGSDSSSTTVKSEGGSLGGGTIVDRQEKMIDGMTAVLSAAGDDASKAATGMAAFYAKHKDAIAAMQKEVAEIQKDPTKAAAMAKDSKKLMGKAMKMGMLMQKFMKDPKFMAAMKQMKMGR